ncbi:MAG: hypothetical protein ACRCTY_06230 [Candidatus Adiutrix sp.]
MNLHKIVGPTLGQVQPWETITLLPCLGQKNIKGQIKAVYGAGINLKARVQSEKESFLEHARQMGQMETHRRFYLYAPKTMALKPSPLNRKLAQGGDFIRRFDGSFWLVTALIEDFSALGWLSLRGTLSLNGPLD